MSLHEAIEIKQREADLHKSAWPRAAATSFFVISMLILLSVITNASGDHSSKREVYSLVMIAGGSAYLAYCHCKHAKRIEVLELELLKLKRDLSFRKPE